MNGAIGQGVAVARATSSATAALQRGEQSLDADVLLDELDASLAQVTTATLSSPAARERWAARLKAFRELRAAVKQLEVRLAAGREARVLREEVADV